MKKQQDVQAKKVVILINTDNRDKKLPILKRFDFLVSDTEDDNKIKRFLCSILRKNKIIFNEIKIEETTSWVSDAQIWSRKRIEKCIENNPRVVAMLTEIHCPKEFETFAS